MSMFSKAYWTKRIMVVCVAVFGSAALAQDHPPLPVLPETPDITVAEYPGCREDYRREEDAIGRADGAAACLQRLDRYYEDILIDYRERMIAHQNEVRRIYEEEVRSNFDYPRPLAEEFYQTVMTEHDASYPEGDHFGTARALEAQYQADRAFLQERFCRYATTCADYEVHAESAERDEADGAVSEGRRRPRRERRAGDGDGGGSCNTERAGGGILGGILGGIVGEATGVGALGGIIAGQFAGVLVAEIACQLEPAEQAVAAEAVEEVTQQEEVGATVEWVSPTRADVSGSSTVTALNSEPSGRRCMDVTDIAIIEGEETRVSRQMCREPGEARYTRVA